MKPKMSPEIRAWYQAITRKGGKARAKLYDSATLSEWARRGGKATAANRTPEERRAAMLHAASARRKITPVIEARIVRMFQRGRKHREIAAKLHISIRSVGRVAAKARERG